MKPVGTHVHHTGHGNGVVVKHNTQPSYFYPPSRYPYVVRYDSGYEDIYAECDVTTGWK